MRGSGFPSPFPAVPIPPRSPAFGTHPTESTRGRVPVPPRIPPPCGEQRPARSRGGPERGGGTFFSSLFIFFILFPPAGAALPGGRCHRGDRGSPGRIGTLPGPADFLTVAGGADMEMSSLRGGVAAAEALPAPGPARPGPTRPSAARGLGGGSVPLLLFGEVSPTAALSPAAGALNPWHAAAIRDSPAEPPAPWPQAVPTAAPGGRAAARAR